MLVTFYSNFLNHHQLPFCFAMQKCTGGNFFYVAGTPGPEERLRLGYKDYNHLPFVVRAYESETEKKRAERLCEESDFIVHGSASEEYIKLRMEKEKLAFRYSERWLKNGLWHMFGPRARYYTYKDHGVYRNKPLYLLCSSAYTAADASRFGAYRKKTYKWGYFPEVRPYENIEKLICGKEENSLVWAGRFLALKHPESALVLVSDLKKAGYKVKLRMIGAGEKENAIKKLIAEKKLEGEIELLGAMSPEKVRAYMEKAEIFLFTSDFNEGWGAVLNEAMNSGCAAVASHAIGSVPYLIKNGENGLIYKNGDRKDLFAKTAFLLDRPAERRAMGKRAYETLFDVWNANVAAERLIALAEELLRGGKSALFTEGPCSPAGILKNNWFR